MTFKDFLKVTEEREVNEFWDSINLVQQEAIDQNWKYSLERNGKVVPFKWFIKSLSKHKNIEVDFGSNSENRDSFAEKFGFSIREDLVFDKEDLKRFTKWYENQVGNKDLFQFFINHAGDVLSSYNIHPYKVRMAITHGNEAMIIVGMRAVLSYKNDKIGFIVKTQDLPEIQKLYHFEKDYDFKGGNELSFVYSQPNFVIDNSIKYIIEKNSEAINAEYISVKDTPRSRWNSGANSTNSTLKKIMFNKDNVEDFLSQKPKPMTQIIDLGDSKLYKFSMGSLLKDPHYKRINPIDDLENDDLIVMHKDTANGQGDKFINKVKIGDYIYLTYGQKRLSFIAKIISECKPINDFKNIDLDDNWMARQVEIVKNPLINNTNDLKDKEGWLPSGYTTLKEIIDIKRANKILFNKYYDVEFRSEQTLSGVFNSENDQDEKDFPLNQILYGSPGTGKTYNTKRLAVEIIEGQKFSDSKEDRDEILKLYDEYLKNKQIRFTTFHQSLSYEDFIEGIKPKMGGSSNEDVEYEIRDGIFKLICHDADLKKTSNNFEESYSKFIDEVSETGSIVLYSLVHKKPFDLRINSNQNCVAIPHTETRTNMVITKKMIEEYILNDNIIDWKTYVTAIGEHIKSKYNITVQNSDNQNRNYVLIMDEINRGNVSSIFGELITLIEDDKRKGSKEGISVDLPYSQTKFSVPKNVYLIGTMNTADRSVEALDTALRRRFSFVEMKSDPQVLRSMENEGLIEGNIDLVRMLDVINQRIELLIDKDHQIGHSYFINVTNLKALQFTFNNKIIPLLEEYFYGDFGKIGLVLGESFVNVQDVKHNKGILSNFKGYEDVDFLTDKKLFTVRNSYDLGISDFISIYKDVPEYQFNG